MHVIESFKLLGIISIAITWLSLVILVTKWPRDNSISFSRHAARSKQPYLMMAFSESFTVPAFILFCWFWFIPTFSLSVIFTIGVISSGMGFLIGAWLPDTVGLKHIIHQIVAYGAATLFIPCAAILALSSHISTAGRVLSGASTIYMATMIAAFFLYPKAKDHHLIFQTIYIVCFHMSILLAVYIR